MRTCLVDTGPIVAYLDAKDPAHAEVARHLDRFAVFAAAKLRYTVAWVVVLFNFGILGLSILGFRAF